MMAPGTQFDGVILLPKSPLFVAKLKASNVFPLPGRKPLISVALKTPAVRLALPVTKCMLPACGETVPVLEMGGRLVLDPALFLNVPALTIDPPLMAAFPAASNVPEVLVMTAPLISDSPFAGEV